MSLRRADHWIEIDSYDRDAFTALLDDTPSLRRLAETGARLLPHFDSFLLDLFAVFFKLNLLLREPEQVVPSAAFFRFLLDQILASPGLSGARRHTALDEARAGAATLLLGERLLDLLKAERILTRGEMLDAWNLQRQGDEIAERAADEDTLADLLAQARPPQSERRLGELGKRLERENAAAQRHLEHHAARFVKRLRDGAARDAPRLAAELERSAAEIQAFDDNAEEGSLALGLPTGGSAGMKIELGHRLARNPKLRRMADLVGRMRQTARALRRKTYERADGEVYAIDAGDELSRILPSELAALRHPALRRDFQRRLIDRKLLVYALREREQKGRGPLVVCLDCSSSMAGDKEIWSKAVALTLLDIAGRQRRCFRSIAFAAADTPLQVLEMGGRGRAQRADIAKVFDLAEHFPGGGTDFQKPLDAALECLGGTARGRGDIVLITDGECRVAPAWLERFQAEKKRRGFALFSVLIDVGPSSVQVLTELSDRVTSVHQLTTEASQEIFLRI